MSHTATSTVVKAVQNPTRWPGAGFKQYSFAEGKQPHVNERDEESLAPQHAEHQNKMK